MLQTEELVVGYPGRQLLGPLRLALGAGELVVLLGANGRGKSTLMRTLCGMQPALAGVVRLQGEVLHRMPASARARRLAVVLTDRIQAGLMRGRELVALGRTPFIGWDGRLREEDERIVDEALADVDGQGLGERLVAELSDGERQRMMIARALAQQPQVLVLDEVTAFLDLPRRIEIMALLQRLAQRRRLAILLSSHDLELALRSADRIWLIDAHGHLHDSGPEDLVLAGRLDQAFPAQGMRFDIEQGEFRIGHAAEPGAGIHVLGEGATAAWARRAVQRAGCRVAGGDEPVDWQLQVGTEGYRLERHGGPSASCASLSDVVARLREVSR
jgi:iron complex transport system ATP-binding protein